MSHRIVFTSVKKSLIMLGLAGLTALACISLPAPAIADGAHATARLAAWDNTQGLTAGASLHNERGLGNWVRSSYSETISCWSDDSVTTGGFYADTTAYIVNNTTSTITYSTPWPSCDMFAYGYADASATNGSNYAVSEITLTGSYEPTARGEAEAALTYQDYAETDSIFPYGLSMTPSQRFDYSGYCSGSCHTEQ